MQREGGRRDKKRRRETFILVIGSLRNGSNSQAAKAKPRSQELHPSLPGGWQEQLGTPAAMPCINSRVDHKWSNPDFTWQANTVHGVPRGN